MEHAVLPNPPQVGIRVKQPARAADGNGAWAEVNVLENNILHIWPTLDYIEDAEDLPLDGLGDHQDLGHVVPGLGADAEDGDEDPANEHLQRMDQEDLRALRSILGLPIAGNAITGRHLWQVLKKLRGVLPKGGGGPAPLMAISKGQEYARILERLARVMTIPDSQDYKAALGVHPLPCEVVFKVLNEMTPDFACPLDNGECLDRLCEDLTATACVMRVAEGIFVVKDREQFARRLRSLGARL